MNTYDFKPLKLYLLKFEGVVPLSNERH